MGLPATVINGCNLCCKPSQDGEKETLVNTEILAPASPSAAAAGARDFVSILDSAIEMQALSSFWCM